MSINNYNPSENQQFNYGLCTGLGYFDLGSGNCASNNLSQTPTFYDAWAWVALNVTGIEPNYNPLLGGELIDYQFWRYVATFNLFSVWLLIIIIPESLIIMKRISRSKLFKKL
jgi:hypothetical protein